MKSASPRLQVACIQICALFHDPALADYLLPGLKSNSPFVRAQTVLALWQFPSYRKRLRLTLYELNCLSKREDFLAYCSVIGDIGNKNDRADLLLHFEVDDPLLKITMAFALFKLGYEKAGDVVVHLLFSKNLLVLEKSKEFFRSLSSEQKKFLQNIVRREASLQLQPVFSSKGSKKSKEEISSIVQCCRDTFLSFDLRDEAENIHSFLTASGLQFNTNQS
jgi:hypothetical protein